jgi:hypothetical protein
MLKIAGDRADALSQRSFRDLAAVLDGRDVVCRPVYVPLTAGGCHAHQSKLGMKCHLAVVG